MTRNFCTLLLLLLFAADGKSCTTFFLHHNNEMVFGRNYDWSADAGIICTNQRGLAKTSFPASDGKTISWEAKYGSITFNQYGKEFPTGGMNEKGLVVELMWLDETRYPEPDDRPSIGALQWIQYQLDNSATIDEVISTDKQLRISSLSTPLHYLIADANGNAATIEFLEGKLIVHRDKALALPVLTNDDYSSSLSAHKENRLYGNSLERFSQACSMISGYKAKPTKTSAIDFCFQVLESVSQGNFTKWSIVYDIGNRNIYFKTNRFPSIRLLPVKAMEFECNKPSKVYDLNTEGSGNISGSLVDFSMPLNRSILDQAVQQSSDRVSVTEAEKEALLAYSNSPNCR